MNSPFTDSTGSALDNYEEENIDHADHVKIENDVSPWFAVWEAAVPLNTQYSSTLGWGNYSSELNELLLKTIAQSGKALVGVHLAYGIGMWQYKHNYATTAINGVLDSATWALLKKELIQSLQSRIMVVWGSKADIAAGMTRLIGLHLPYAYGKTYDQLTTQQKTEYATVWAQIRTDILIGRRKLISSGFIPVLGTTKVPFGFYLSTSGKGLGTFNSVTRYFEVEQTDKVLVRLYQQGKITITQDQLDLFQRFAKSETYGKIQLLNSYDSAFISMGFMQLTLQHGKVQEWIKAAPAAFRRYGIELHPTGKYDFGAGEIHEAIVGVLDADKDNLRFNGWAERFFYAGLDEEIIIAEVSLAKLWITRHQKDLRSRLHKIFNNDDYYNLFINNYYKNDPYIRGLFHASLNNLPAASVKCVIKAIETNKTATVAEFLETYKGIIRVTNDWYDLVDNASHGTSLVLSAPATQPEYGFDNESEEWDNEYDEEQFYESSENEYINEHEYSYEEDHEENGSEDYSAAEEAAGMNEPGMIDEIDAAEIYETTGYENEARPFEYDIAPIPSGGLTEYIATSGVKGQALKTGVFIPPGFVFSSGIDIIIYLHGFWRAGDEKDGMETYWNKYSNLRAHFFLGGRNAILIAPLLGRNPEKSSHVFLYKNGFDNFIASCFAELKAKNCLPADANPNRIILAAHSAGGKPMSIILNSKSNTLLKNIDECWGFDCLYGYDFNSWLQKDKASNKLYHYWAYTASGTKSRPGKNGDKLQKDNSANMFNIAPKEKIKHPAIIQYAWRDEINKRPWFQPIPSFAVDTSNEAPLIKQLPINRLWINRFPRYQYHAVPKTLPVTAAVHTCTATAMPSAFTKTHFSVSTDVAKGASESSYDFTRRMIKAIGQDPDTWYNNFTKTTFLGVSCGTIHIELANLLKNIETAFINTHDPVNKNICTVRQKLGITTADFSGGRKEPTAALKSMHLFGLALDVNMAGNPFVQNKEIERVGKYGKYIQPNGVDTINELLANGDKLFGGSSTKFKYQLSYDVYRTINDALTRYLKIMDDDSMLQAALKSTANSEWKSRSLSSAKEKIKKDLEKLATALVRWSEREDLKTKGFIDLSKQFVDGMVAGGLNWGGSGYGDMMHFDMRTTGVGKKIHDAIAAS